MRSRRRADEDLSKKVFAYFTTEEYKAVQKAAKLERRSLSSFVALAALDAARSAFRKPHRNLPLQATHWPTAQTCFFFLVPQTRALKKQALRSSR
ncbi:MAG: DUF1778 domain-containing protein [Acidobacteriia bacterium]|nr:DUF1778 domain-containing protein [Terriglobia bacterium]